MSYYKVVNHNHFSVCTNRFNPTDSPFVVEYKEGEYTYPKVEGTKLFAFDHEEDPGAIDLFCGGLRTDYEIWACEVINPAPEYKHFLKSVYADSFEERLEAVLACTSDQLRQMEVDEGFSLLDILEESWMAWPSGTVFCDAIMLTKLVYRSEGVIDSTVERYKKGRI